MLQYMVAGLVLGGIYAIAATGLVVTYQSAGILNFSLPATIIACRSRTKKHAPS